MGDKLIQYLLMGVLASGGIAVPAQQACVGEGAGGFLFNLLCADAEKLDPLAAALRANIRDRGAIIALMAD